MSGFRHSGPPPGQGKGSSQTREAQKALKEAVRPPGGRISPSRQLKWKLAPKELVLVPLSQIPGLPCDHPGRGAGAVSRMGCRVPMRVHMHLPVPGLEEQWQPLPAETLFLPPCPIPSPSAHPALGLSTHTQAKWGLGQVVPRTLAQVSLPSSDPWGNQLACGQGL